MSKHLETFLKRNRELAEAELNGDEEWRPIPINPLYEVSSLGRVRSWQRRGNFKVKKIDFANILKQSLNTNGYPTACIIVDGKPRTKPVHRLVALAFLGECPPNHEVAHLNGVKTDARASNIRYLTHRENEKHKVSHGSHNRGEQNHQSLLKDWMVDEILFLRHKGISRAKIVALFGIKPNLVSTVTRREQWKYARCRTDLPKLVDALDAATKALEFIARGCLVPPDGGSPRLEDAVKAASEALAALEEKAGRG